MYRLSYRLLILGFSGFLAACALGPRPAEVGTKDTSRSFRTVVVDAGHGGKDNGAYGQSRRSHGKFPGFTTGELPGGTGRVRFSEQSIGGRPSARRRISRNAGRPDCGSSRGAALRCRRLSRGEKRSCTTAKRRTRIGTVVTQDRLIKVVR